MSEAPALPPELAALLMRAKARLAEMTPAEREAHFAEQRANWVAAEMALSAIERETTTVGPSLIATLTAENASLRAELDKRDEAAAQAEAAPKPADDPHLTVLHRILAAVEKLGRVVEASKAADQPIRGCGCPAGAEATCAGLFCPRRVFPHVRP